MTILEVLGWLESEFGLTNPDEKLSIDSFCSVGKMADYVIKHQ